MLDKIDLIAYDVIKKMDSHSLDIIAGKVEPTFLRSQYDMAVASHICDNYGLRRDNPLTAKWRSNTVAGLESDGVDYSRHHPDTVSARIYKLIQKHLSLYPGRMVSVVASLKHPTSRAHRFVGHPMVIVKRTKGGLIEVAHAKYPKRRVSVHEDEVIFEGS